MHVYARYLIFTTTCSKLNDMKNRYALNTNLHILMFLYLFGIAYILILFYDIHKNNKKFIKSNFIKGCPFSIRFGMKWVRVDYVDNALFTPKFCRSCTILVLLDRVDRVSRRDRHFKTWNLHLAFPNKQTCTFTLKYLSKKHV